MVAGWVAEEEFAPVGLIRVRTESSIWLLGPGKYQHLPREEQPRAAPPLRRTAPRRLRVARHAALLVDTYGDGRRALRILPIAGPPEGHGVVSGLIVEVSGEWESLAAVE